MKLLLPCFLGLILISTYCKGQEYANHSHIDSVLSAFASFQYEKSPFDSKVFKTVRKKHYAYQYEDLRFTCIYRNNLSKYSSHIIFYDTVRKTAFIQTKCWNMESRRCREVSCADFEFNGATYTLPMKVSRVPFKTLEKLEVGDRISIHIASISKVNGKAVIPFLLVQNVKKL